MKKILFFVGLCFFAATLNGCMVRITPPGSYPVSPEYVTYTQPSYYNMPYYNGSYYDGGSYYAPARPARNCGPTPFEVVFGKGALKQSNNNRQSQQQFRSRRW